MKLALLAPGARRLLPAVLLAALAAAHACDQSRTVGSRWVRSQQIHGADGGTIAVPLGAGETLGGAQLILDPNAVQGDVLVTLEEAGAPLGTNPRGAGPVASWGPAVALLHPAQMTLPFVLGAGQSAADLIIYSASAGGQVTRVDHSRLAIDAANGLVTFPAEHLGSFQAAAVVRCTSSPECGEDLICRNSECQKPDAGPVTCSTVGCICSLQVTCLLPLICREGTCHDAPHDGGPGP